MKVCRRVNVCPSRGPHLSFGKSRPSPYPSCYDRESSRVACLQHRYFCTTMTNVLSCSECFEHFRRLSYELVPDAGASHLRLGFLITEPSAAVAPMTLANQLKSVVLSVVCAALWMPVIAHHLERWRRDGKLELQHYTNGTQRKGT